MFLLSYGIHSVWLSVAWKTADTRRLHWFPPRNNVWETGVEVTCHYPDLASVSDWSWRVGNLR